MNKFCYTAFIAFWSCVATLLALQILTEDEQVAVVKHSVNQPERQERGHSEGEAVTPKESLINSSILR